MLMFLNVDDTQCSLTWKCSRDKVVLGNACSVKYIKERVQRKRRGTEILTEVSRESAVRNT